MQVILEWMYHTPKGKVVTLQSEPLQVQEALQFAEDMQKTGRVKELRFVDSHDSSWTLKELKKYATEIEQEPHELTLFFDGGFHHEEGVAGAGIVIYFRQNGKHYRLRKNRLFTQLTTNNEAEFAALHFGLEELIHLGAHHLPVTITGDANVVIHELSGEWGMTDGAHARWADKIERLLHDYGLRAHYELVRRQDNREAHQLATQALQGNEIVARMEITGK